jgi:SPP1 gp7 family putative phage head morphogenesis protein
VSQPWNQLPFEGAIAYFRDKRNVDTDSWRDVQGTEYDAAFAVAGAKGALLQDMRDAVDKAISQGTTLQEFRKDFNRIVQTRGWDYAGDRDWRTYAIYDTNLRSAYAAGRWEQIQESKASRPYLQWRHGGSRDPRPLHLALDKQVFRVDDPFWGTMGNPPIGYGCRCQLFALKQRDVDRLGLSVAEGPEIGSVFKGSIVQPDPGWGGGHGRSTPETRRNLLVNITKRLHPALAMQVEQDARFASLRMSKEFGQVEATQLQVIRDRATSIEDEVEVDDLPRADGLYSVIAEQAPDVPEMFRGMIDGLGDLQALAIVDIKKEPDAVMIYSIVTAPWNLRGMPPSGQQVKGAGTRLIADVARESVELGYGGRIRLSASPEAVGYYRSIGFEQEAGSRMMLSPEDAQQLIQVYYG